MSLKESLRIAVVDDMSISRALITQALDEMGIKQYQTESDPKAALGRLTSNPPHLVISDMNMPGMSGLELLKALRLHRMTHRIGFILITGTPSPDVVNGAQMLGANNLVKKPFTTITLKGAIEKVVGKL